MVKSFPPCQALFLDQATCRKIEADPEYNMTAIAWSEDSSAIVILAQVPCTSNFGGISCQSMGYEVEVPERQNLKQLQPPEFKKQYQKFMEQKYEVPIAPQYDAPSRVILKGPLPDAELEDIQQTVAYACFGRTPEVRITGESSLQDQINQDSGSQRHPLLPTKVGSIYSAALSADLKVRPLDRGSSVADWT